MCKDKSTQTLVIDDAKRETRRVYALFERTDYGDDLVCIVKQLADFATLICEVNAEGESRVAAIRKPEFNVSKKAVMDALRIGDDYRFIGGFYRLQTC